MSEGGEKIKPAYQSRLPATARFPLKPAIKEVQDAFAKRPSQTVPRASHTNEGAIAGVTSGSGTGRASETMPRPGPIPHAAPQQDAIELPKVPKHVAIAPDLNARRGSQLAAPPVPAATLASPAEPRSTSESRTWMDSAAVALLGGGEDVISAFKNVAPIFMPFENSVVRVYNLGF